VTAGDPVVGGLISNIARPGGNITGTAISAGFEIWGKRIGLLKEVLRYPEHCSVYHIRSADGSVDLFGYLVDLESVAVSKPTAAAENRLPDASVTSLMGHLTGYLPMTV
jgi:hypothetical protein